MGLAPAVRVTPDIRPDTLHIVKGFLVDDGLMGILENRPLAFVNIVAFLVLEVLSGLKLMVWPRYSRFFRMFTMVDDPQRRGL